MLALSLVGLGLSQWIVNGVPGIRSCKSPNCKTFTRFFTYPTFHFLHSVSYNQPRLKRNIIPYLDSYQLKINSSSLRNNFILSSSREIFQELRRDLQNKGSRDSFLIAKLDKDKMRLQITNIGNNEYIVLKYEENKCELGKVEKRIFLGSSKNSKSAAAPPNIIEYGSDDSFALSENLLIITANPIASKYINLNSVIDKCTETQGSAIAIRNKILKDICHAYFHTSTNSNCKRECDRGYSSSSFLDDIIVSVLYFSNENYLPNKDVSSEEENTNFLFENDPEKSDDPNYVDTWNIWAKKPESRAEIITKKKNLSVLSSILSRKKENQ